MTRVLVTGANGFAGAAICRHLLAQGWAVRGSVRSAGTAVPEGVEKAVTGEIDGATDWTAALEGVDAVVHCAARVHVLHETAEDPLAAFRRVNVAGTRQLARQAVAAGVGHFVFLSSIGAAEAERAPTKANTYQVSKLEAEAALREAAAAGAMKLVMLRPPLIYGPGAPGNFQRLAGWIAAGRPRPGAERGRTWIVTSRGDLFPTHHGAAVKIERTAWGLSHHVDRIVLLTDRRDRYWVYEDGVRTEHSFPLWLRAIGWPRPGNLIRLMLKGLPYSNAFLYLPLVDRGLHARLLWLLRRHPVEVVQAELME